MAAAWLNLSIFGISHSQIHRWWSVELLYLYIGFVSASVVKGRKVVLE